MALSPPRWQRGRPKPIALRTRHRTAAVHDRNGWPVAMLGFSTAAWKFAPRDRFIGWTPERRDNNLALVIENLRFLILAWIDLPDFDCHVLAIVRRRLPGDWTDATTSLPCSSRSSSRHCATPTLSIGYLAGFMSGLPRAGAATTGTSFTTSAARTSGSGPCGAIGSEPSIADIVVLHRSPEGFPRPAFKPSQGNRGSDQSQRGDSIRIPLDLQIPTRQKISHIVSHLLFFLPPRKVEHVLNSKGW